MFEEEWKGGKRKINDIIKKWMGVMCKARESEIANENANNVQISIVENWFGKSSAMQIDFSIVY